MRELWHEKTPEDFVARLASDAVRGLSSEEAARRLERDGPNELRRAEGTSKLEILARQFQSLVIWVLIGAAGISALLGETLDGAAILAIVFLNALVGFFQETRAERAILALARMTAPRAKIVRDGRACVVAAAEIVRGDLVLLEAGDLVAADGRLVEASFLRVNEAPLTGESEPVAKKTGTCAAETPLAERTNMVFLGTAVASGTGRALVVATGMDTEVGQIAELLETASSGETPLQRRLDQVGRRLLWACLGIVVLVFGLGLLRSIPPFELFLSAVSLAVAAIPEGLPAVVTVALALGVSRMVRRNVLVRRLAAVETLGCAQVICTDKTGTLTVGEMTARTLVTGEEILSVTGEGYSTEGAIFADGSERTAEKDPLLRDLLLGAAACNDAELSLRGGRPAVIGDPTEGALLVAAAKGGIRLPDLEEMLPRLATIPFDSDRKRMTVIRRRDGQVWAFVKGAPEVILERCSRIHVTRGVQVLTESDRARMLEAVALLAHEALRTLAIAARPLDPFDGDQTIVGHEDEIECGLTLLGLVGLQDPPRAEAREAVLKCKHAGIRTVMITGDHPDTARAIARELGILEHGDQLMVGSQLDQTSDTDLARQVSRTSVFARVTAEHKLRIVRAWKSHGAVVAMTGDGVNDAPALKEASIGVAMGITGTEVTKEASDIVITDDNFASIVAAVEEGRGIYDNIAKTLSYLLAGNAGELALMFVAVLFGWPLPLLPIHLLWINLVTDGAPALALATDPVDPEVLARPPRPVSSAMIDRTIIRRLTLIGFLTAGVALTAFAYELWVGDSLSDGRNAAFSVLVIAELLKSFAFRSDRRTVWELGLFSNLRLFLTVVASFALQLAIQNLPALQAIFDTKSVSLAQAAAWIALGALPLLAIETSKWSKWGQTTFRRDDTKGCGDPDQKVV